MPSKAERKNFSKKEKCLQEENSMIGKLQLQGGFGVEGISEETFKAVCKNWHLFMLVIPI